MKQKIYLDNAATTPLYPEVVDRMAEVLHTHFGNPSSIHHLGREARTIIEESRKTVANYLQASLGEIFFTSGGTEASNTALKCSVRDLGVKRIITSHIEHHCVSHSIASLIASANIQVEYVNLEPAGRPDLGHLRTLLQDSSQTTLVSLMHANNEIGTMIDLSRTGELCREYGAYFHSDTVQTFGHFPLDLSTIEIDFVTGAAHKFHGPKGVGVLYINGDIAIKPMMDGGGQERNMRAGTENISGIAGLATALQVSIDRMDENHLYVKQLRDRLRTDLEENFDGLQIHGDPDGEALNTVLNVGFPPSAYSDLLLLNLDIEGICASGGSACSSGAAVGSHVIAHLYPEFKGSAIRFSFSEMNTSAEVGYLVEKLQNILKKTSLQAGA